MNDPAVNDSGLAVAAPAAAARGLISMPAVALVWLGAVLAIALEAGVKFQAPLMTREVGLDVGRTVFTAFNRVEIVLALLAAALAVWQRESAPVRNLLLVAVVALLAQTVWLLPALNERADAIIGGGDPGGSFVHHGYLIAEGIKVLALAAAAHLALRNGPRPPRTAVV